MRYYESLYIVNPNYENDRLDEVMKMVTDKLGEYKFSIINHRSWGKKRLAYSIQKHKYGSFILLHFETESVGNLNRFERFMVLQKQILRNQTICLDTKPEIKIEEKQVNESIVNEEKESTTKKTKEVTEEVVEEVVEDTTAAEEAEATEETTE